MELNQYLRVIIHQKIRPLFIKEKCEVCGDEDNLHLHHVKHFHVIVSETLKELFLINKDTEEYKGSELELIINVMLGKHLNTDYLTLCNDCHIKIHENEWKDVTCNKRHFEKTRRKRN